MSVTRRGLRALPPYVRSMTNDEQLFKEIRITEPIAGLDEAYEAAPAEYVLEIAERLLGFAGRMISGSKTGFSKHHPDHFPVFNANVCTDARRGQDLVRRPRPNRGRDEAR